MTYILFFLDYLHACPVGFFFSRLHIFTDFSSNAAIHHSGLLVPVTQKMRCFWRPIRMYFTPNCGFTGDGWEAEKTQHTNALDMKSYLMNKLHSTFMDSFQVPMKMPYLEDFSPMLLYRCSINVIVLKMKGNTRIQWHSQEPVSEIGRGNKR